MTDKINLNVKTHINNEGVRLIQIPFNMTGYLEQPKDTIKKIWSYRL